QIECTQITLTVNEKKMILSIHNYLQEKMKMTDEIKITDEQSKKATNLRKEVFIATKVDEATVAHVIAEFNKTEKIISSEQGHRAPKDFYTEYVNAEEIKSDVVVLCWKKCLGKARNYWEMVNDGINNESEDEDIDLYSGDENLNEKS
ncbi:2833_t:CDS:2, partial [Cetraspora pellucida]